MIHESMKRVFSVVKDRKVDIARKIDVEPQSITNWEKRGVSKNGALKIAEAYNLTAQWILTGKKTDEKESQANTKPFDPTTMYGYAVVDDWDEDTPLEGDEVAIPFYKELAFACGHGAEGEVREEEWRRLRFSRLTLDRMGVYRDKTFAAITRDDSMLPTIQDGDTIFVDENRNNIKDGKIFAIEHGGLHYCKRLYKLPNGGVRIVSDNSDEFPEIRLTRDEITSQEFRVIGWVYSISRLERWQ